MMNPLSRKMFRSSMASRMPQGILASSAPMMTSAQKAMAKNQPMKAQTGASVNTQNYMSAIAQLTQQGDVQTLTNILQDTRLPTRVRTAARDAIGSLQPKPRNIGPQVPPQVGPPMASIPSIQSPPAVTVPGYSVGTDGAVLAGLTDDQLAARMSAEADALNAEQSKTTTVSPSVSSFDPTLTRRAYDMNLQSSSPLTSTQAQSSTATQMPPSVSSFDPTLTRRAYDMNLQSSSPLTSTQAQSGTSGISNMLGGAFAYPGDINKALDYAYPESPPGSSRLDRALNFLQRGAFATIRAPYDVSAQIAGFGRDATTGTIDYLTKPYFTEEEKKAQLGEFEGLEDLPETPSLNLLPQSSSILQDDPALVEQEVVTPDITDTGVGADMEETATTATTEPSLTDKARTKLNDMLIDLETNDTKAVKPATADVAGPKKFTRKRPLTIEEGTTSEATKIYGQVLPEKVSLSEVEEELKSQFDLDPSKYDEKKQNAFWMNVTMAGLAIAAGESDNALSNIAKGLMVGVDSYGKDLKDLNAQEREDQKEYRAAMRQLISDKRSENIAVAQMQNSWSMGMNQLNQQRDQFASEMEFKQAQQEWSQKMAGMQLTATITTDLAKLELQEETLDYTKTQNQLKNKLDAYMQSPEHVQTFISAGLMDIDPDTNMPVMTPEGEEYQDFIIAAGLSDLTTAEKSTDTSKAAAALTRIKLGQGNQNDISLVSIAFKDEIEEAGGFGEFIKTVPVIPTSQSGFTIVND